MADEQSPSVQVEAPTVIISNSDNGSDNGSEIEQTANSDNGDGSHSNHEPAQSIGDGVSPSDSGSEQVTIAAIEAERDIALAEIHSDVERERIAVEAERVEVIADRNEELEECRNQIAELRGRMEVLESQLIPPPVLEAEATEILETVPESDLIQPDTAAPIAETQTEHGEESVVESLEEVIPNRVRRFIAI